MVRVIPGQQAIRPGGYHLYHQPIGGTKSILVRRKLVEQPDVQHANSIRTTLQRQRFSKAAKDWSKELYRTKQYWRKRWEYI